MSGKGVQVMEGAAQGQRRVWGWVTVGLFLLLAVVVLAFWWRNQQARVAKVESPAATMHLGAPVTSTESVPNFPVGGAVVQKGTLEGPISGSCGNIKWRQLTPAEEANLRKLCPGGTTKGAH